LGTFNSVAYERRSLSIHCRDFLRPAARFSRWVCSSRWLSYLALTWRWGLHSNSAHAYAAGARIAAQSLPPAHPSRLRIVLNQSVLLHEIMGAASCCCCCLRPLRVLIGCAPVQAMRSARATISSPPCARPSAMRARCRPCPRSPAVVAHVPRGLTAFRQAATVLRAVKENYAEWVQSLPTEGARVPPSAAGSDVGWQPARSSTAATPRAAPSRASIPSPRVRRRLCVWPRRSDRPDSVREDPGHGRIAHGAQPARPQCTPPSLRRRCVCCPDSTDRRWPRRQRRCWTCSAQRSAASTASWVASAAAAPVRSPRPPLARPCRH
jgi:hypothetical protein